MDGLLARKKVATSVEDHRIGSTIILRGKRTLLVLGELDAMDKNSSIVDLVVAHYMDLVENLTRKLKYMETQMTIQETFIK